MNIRVLTFEGCPNDRHTLELVCDVLSASCIQATVERIEVTPESCTELRFLGSPTVQIDGVDIEPAARTATHFAMTCRTYEGSGGVPPRHLIRDAIAEKLSDH